MLFYTKAKVCEIVLCRSDVFLWKMTIQVIEERRLEPGIFGMKRIEKNTKGYTKNKRKSRDAIGICAPSFLVRPTVHVWFYFDFPYFSSQYMQR